MNILLRKKRPLRLTLRKACENLAKSLRKPCESVAKTLRKAWAPAASTGPPWVPEGVPGGVWGVLEDLWGELKWSLGLP